MTSLWTPPPGSLLPRTVLLARGVHPRRLASDEFLAPLPGQCTPAAAPASLLRIARVLQRDLCPEALISHVTAAEILGLPLPRELRHAAHSTVHVTIPPDMRRRLGPRVRVHRRRTGSTYRAGGIVMPGMLDLLCGLAGMLTPLELVQVCDAAVSDRAGPPLIALADLREQVTAASTLTGIAALRVAVEASRERVESPKETELRLLLLRHGLAEPEINLPVQLPDGRGRVRTFRLDLSYPALRLAIEYDGDGHRTDRAQWSRDRRKDDMLHEAGWRVVRVTQADLVRPQELIGRLTTLGAPRS